MSSAHTLESMILNSTPDVGYPDQIILPLRSWVKSSDSTVLTGASTPAVSVVAGSEFLQWAANAANTVVCSNQFSMPETYAYRTGNPGREEATIDTGATLDDQLWLQVDIRRQRNQADTDAWSARCTVTWYTPGTDSSANSLTTNPTVSIASISADNTASLAGLSRLKFDIGARLRAEGKRILPGDVVRLQLGPDAADADCVMQIASTTVKFRRHATIRDLTERGIQ